MIGSEVKVKKLITKLRVEKFSGSANSNSAGTNTLMHVCAGIFFTIFY
jgi:hypothetical protein